jgi:hypothetical protein
MPMKHIYSRISLAAVALVFFLFSMPAGPLPVALGQEGQVTREDLNKILQRLDDLSKKNAQLEKKNEDVIKTNSELTSRIKVLEQQNQAAAPAAPRPAQNITELSTRVQNLESQIQQASGGRAAGSSEDVAQLKEDVKELSGIMQEVERKTLTDKIKFGAELRTRFDWFNYSTNYKNLYGIKLGLGNTVDHPTDQHVQDIPSLRFRLNLSTEVINNLKLHARLTMYKIWNDQHTDAYPYNNMLNYSRTPQDNTLRVERAYADYYFKIWEKFPMALTFGRLPTTDSFPTDLRDDTPRKSTYPGLAFDAEADGVGLTTDLSQLTGLPDSAVRFMWSRLVPDDEQGYWKEADQHTGNMDFYMLQFETGLPGRLRDTLLIFNTTYFPEVPSAELPGIPFVAPINHPQDLGSLWKFTLFAESKRFLGSRFDLFAGYSFQKSSASGKATTYGIGPIPIMNAGLLNENGNSDRTAHALHVGFRYTFPWEILNDPKFGFEYNSGSKYWFGLNAGAEDPLMKLDTRGDAYDFYYIQPINENFFFRFGYTMLHRKYSGLWMWGQPPKVTERINNMYLLMDARF